jgi:DNA-binding MarR family transcriptional regulator
MVETRSDSAELAKKLRPILLRLARHLRGEILESVTGGQVALLVAIEFHPGMTGQELAERESLSVAGISGHLARLEGARLIRRERSGDGRRVGIQLTAEGSRVLASVREQRTAWLAGRLELLEPAARDAIRAALGPLDDLSTGER